MENKISFISIVLMIFGFLMLMLGLHLVMLSTMLEARNLAASASIPEYNDGGAAGKFSSDVPIEDQILRAEVDRKAIEKSYEQ